MVAAASTTWPRSWSTTTALAGGCSTRATSSPCELDANDIHACYFDCRATLGGFVELHSHTDRIAATFARWQRAHEEWDGRGDPLRHHTSGT